MTSNSAALPSPTRDLDQADRDLKDHGLCMIEGALDPALLKAARDALYRVAEEDRTHGWVQKFGGDYEHDDTNQRVWNLPSRSALFCDLVEHPLALRFVEQIVGRPALLSNFSANITGPGGGEMVLHADQTYMPEPWSGPQGINIIWCFDDFTDENGATQVVPGTHKLNRTPKGDEGIHDTVPMEAPAGTMIAMEGRVWHRTGNNRTKDARRAGGFAWYTPPIYRTQENWFLSLNPAVRQFGSETLQELFGFKATGFGMMNGASPH